MKAMEIRTARPDDLAAILTLIAEDALREVSEPTSPTSGHRAAIEEIVADPHVDLLVGEIDGRLVATATVHWLRVLIYDGGLLCQIESVRTASEVRGLGLGTQLIQHIVAEARARGCGRVQLATNLRRTRARAFYARFGFVESHAGLKLSLASEARR